MVIMDLVKGVTMVTTTTVMDAVTPVRRPAAATVMCKMAKKNAMTVIKIPKMLAPTRAPRRVAVTAFSVRILRQEL
jgi:hypothetical protein